MHERGEALPLDDPFEQGLQTVLELAERFKDVPHDTYTQLSWSPDGQTITGAVTREIIDAKRDWQADREQGTISEYAVTLREWSSDKPDVVPPVETRSVIDYQTGHFFKMDGFTGRPTTRAGLLEPFFEYPRCNSDERRRQLVSAISIPNAILEPDLRRRVLEFRNSLLKSYTPDDIDRYLRIVDGIEAVPEPLDKATVSDMATRRLINSLTPQGRKAAKKDEAQENERIRTAALKLEQTELLDASYFASPHAYNHPVFSEILHERLQSDRREATLRATGEDPYIFAQKYMSTILGIYAAAPNRHANNTRLVLRDTKESAQHAYVNPSRIIETANKITARRSDIAPLPPLRSIQGLGNVGEAFFRILSITRQPNTEHTDADITADRTHAEIVDMILESVMRREIGRRVITVAELAGRYPDASGEEFLALRDALQNGTPYPQLSKLYKQLVQQRKQK